jgi:hypothetical protein
MKKFDVPARSANKSVSDQPPKNIVGLWGVRYQVKDTTSTFVLSGR